MPLLNPKPITLTTSEGEERTYILSKLPAIQGREVACQYPTSMIPKLGDYAVNKDMMLKLIAYAAVRTESGVEIALTTEALINNHVPDFETLMKLEWAMVEYNVSFLRNGGSSTFFEGIARKARPFSMKILTDLLGQLYPKAAQPSKS